ncbi:glycerate dehydrogenase [Ectopseudomonas composti]|uniref:Glycerate dehydrogenase n=1 Tax=Ectopseudomonas composti TaxID=658457 RepID=A0A1I5L480_9GAMM|nr:D-2-hydroxyacid dehydrogenase [Pseudomonas composti]SFO92008.1 glycerate dehydrogenase [Pseudomonas composti]
MNVVFLDSDSLPLSLSRPAWVSSWNDRPATLPADLLRALAGADIVITNKVRLTRETLRQSPNVRFICVAASGYDCVDVAACRDLGIAVANVPAYSAQSVAESVIASVFALRRQLFAYRDAALRKWSSSLHFCVHAQPVQDVRGAVLGIIGKGAIGQATARLAEAIGMQVLFAEHRGRVDVRPGYVAFDEVLQYSDVISLHCPLTPESHALIGEAELAHMRPGALLINTARGPLIDEQALIAALRSGHLGGAALDVLVCEPPAATQPLLNLMHPNLIVTPHVAWASQSSLQALAKAITENLSAFASGNPINLVS